jgi:hypothetical protein
MRSRYGRLAVTIRFAPLAALLAGAASCGPSAVPVQVGAPVPRRMEAVRTGERARVEYTPDGRDTRSVAGFVVRADATGLRLVADQGDTVVVVREELDGLWVSRGQRIRAGPVAAGAAVGILAGMFGGALLRIADDSPSQDRASMRARVALGAGAAGALVGAWHGSSDNWVRVPLEPRR